MSKIADDIGDFLRHYKLLKGDEKGEAQVFCDRLFIAFGHKGYKEAGATLEDRIKKNSTRGTSFADLVWKPRVLIEMKRRGEKLQLHYEQAFSYWLNAVPNRPRYVVLCNFDEFWIYDFDKQLDEPVDRIATKELPNRYTALSFLFADNPEPIFNNDREAVSRLAAAQLGDLFRRLVSRRKDPMPRDQAQRFVLQLVVSMFAEDIDLLPSGTIMRIARDCREHGGSSYDLFAGLFRQMNDPVPAKAGRFAGVRYFNGGLFSTVVPIELTNTELDILAGVDGVAGRNWSKVNPAIFGTLFEQSMDAKVQHQHGRHFTSEADILRIVGPTIVRPFKERIDRAKTIKELVDIRRDLSRFQVLDPACGSGNFLYVAYRELARLDIRLMTRLQLNFSHKEFERRVTTLCAVSPKQFHGIDNDLFGVELAKVTLMLAKKLVLDEAVAAFAEAEEEYGKGTAELAFAEEEALPLDNLDRNVVCADALFTSWPTADAIVGNPPYQSKNKRQEEFGAAYLNRLQKRYPDISGRADYCVYWFRRAHDHLKLGQRAGLVGTNTIRQNYSRQSGLEYITKDGTITEAVSSMIWPGEAVVHVSIVNWIKGKEKGDKRLYTQTGDYLEEGWAHADLKEIGPSLTTGVDVSTAVRIDANARHGGCYQGQTHGHEAFLMDYAAATRLIRDNPSYKKVLKPFLIADELIGEVDSQPSRYVIDFSGLGQFEAKKYTKLFARIEDQVLPARKKAAQKEKARNKVALDENLHAKVNRHHENFLNKWWQMSYPREDMMKELSKLDRYIVCGQVTRRPIFEFVSTNINPNAALIVFAHEDDYTFGVLQSSIHWDWFVARCSTLKSDFRYTSNTVFDSFPWPQRPSRQAIKDVAKAAVALRRTRSKLKSTHKLSLRDLYRSMENPGAHPLKDAQSKLDDVVRLAYGMKRSDNSQSFLLKLNHEVSLAEKKGKHVDGPGLPKAVKDPDSFITDDCIEI